MAKTLRIVPAVLTDNTKEAERMLQAAAAFSAYVQIDIMGGRFVPSRSLSHQELAGMTIRMPWEAHLMVDAPESYLETCARQGASKIIFHHESTLQPKKVIDNIRALGMEAGLAVNPETGIAAFARLVGMVDSILFMAVHPGYYGARLVPEVLEKIEAFRREFPDIPTGIDGGVKRENVSKLAALGIDDICVGSAIFMQDDPAVAGRELSELAQAARSKDTEKA